MVQLRDVFLSSNVAQVLVLLGHKNSYFSSAVNYFIYLVMLSVSVKMLLISSAKAFYVFVDVDNKVRL